MKIVIVGAAGRIEKNPDELTQAMRAAVVGTEAHPQILIGVPA